MDPRSDHKIKLTEGEEDPSTVLAGDAVGNVIMLVCKPRGGSGKIRMRSRLVGIKHQ